MAGAADRLRRKSQLLMDRYGVLPGDPRWESFMRSERLDRVLGME